MAREPVVLSELVGHIGQFLEADVSHLDLESRLATAVPKLDSLKLFEMILYLEDCLGVEFDEKIMEKIDTVGDLLRYVNTQREARLASA